MLLGDERRAVAGRRLRESWEQPELLAAEDGLGAAGGAEFIEGAGAVGFDGVFGDEEVGGDLAIAEAVGNEGEDFELAGGDAEGLLLEGVGGEGFGYGRRGGERERGEVRGACAG